MPFVTLANDNRIYYELTGPEDGPIVMQFGGSLFGRHNFGFVNDGFRERGFRLLSFDATGYGRSDCPNTEHSVENWADEGALLLDALGFDRVFVHGTSMGGMVTIAFVGKYPERTIAACADCGMARCDLYRKVYFGTWRKMAEAMPLDDFCDLVTIQAVGDQFLADNPGTFDLVRHVIRLNPPYTIRWACLAMENMDNEHLARQIKRPILFTNGSRDTMTPPRLATGGFSAHDIADAIGDWATVHEFTEIGHAGLLECPAEATELVTSFFKQHADA
jgi:pimeloyl-ACP methyl ester carboxylesterase